MCEACIFGKMKRAKFPTSDQTNRAKKPLERIHADICGPMRVRSKGGNRYFLVFVDDSGRKIWVYFMQCKSQAIEKFKEFKAEVEKQTGRKIKCVRVD